MVLFDSLLDQFVSGLFRVNLPWLSAIEFAAFQQRILVHDLKDLDIYMSLNMRTRNQKFTLYFMMAFCRFCIFKLVTRARLLRKINNGSRQC